MIFPHDPRIRRAFVDIQQVLVKPANHTNHMLDVPKVHLLALMRS